MLGPKATGAEEAAQREHKEDTKEGESKPCPEPIRPIALKVLSGLEIYQNWSYLNKDSNKAEVARREANI